MAQRTIGQGVGFERTRRITGYLSTVARFNNAKQSELKDRVLHVGLPATCIGFKFPTWEKREVSA